MQKFFVLTPCYNSERYIEETINSVLLQTAIISGRAQLEYFVLDGLSTDKTVEIVKHINSPCIRILSQKDKGMYDALAHGFRNIKEKGVCCYINAGDIYSPQAFDIVLDIFESKPAKWLTGMNATYNDRSQLVKISTPFKYRKRLFECGAYGTLLPFVQQEVTFWNSDLNALISFDRLSEFERAGDYYMWHEFSRVESLNIVEAHLGGFRIHGGQLSEDINKYLKEIRQITKTPNPIDLIFCAIDKLLWYAPGRIKKYLNKDHYYKYDHKNHKWI